MKPKPNAILSALFTLALTATLIPFSRAQVQTAPEGIVGLDHIPFVVADLDAAVQFWRAIGFSIKPGTAQDNGIRNNHIKFADGSGIELITAPAAVDKITTQYRELIEQADGPAYFGLFARDMDKLSTTLELGKYQTNDSNGLLMLDSRHLDYLFFLNDNRERNDDIYLKHANGSHAMVRVWVATNRSQELADLLVALGGELTARAVYVPDRVSSKVVTVTNGEVLILPVDRQLTKDRAIVGATFLVSNLVALEKRLTVATIPFIKGGSGHNSVIIAPAETHGMWLEFQE